DFLTLLRHFIQQEKVVLAVLDPLFKALRFPSDSDYAVASRVLEDVIELARDTGCHILFTHHNGKNDREGGDALLGTTAIFGAVDTLMLMHRKAIGRTVESIQRCGE